MSVRSIDNDPIYQDLVFSLPMREGAGVPHDVARPHHPMSLGGAPTWTKIAPSGIWVMDFNGTNDYLRCLAAACTDLNFTTEDFSLACWINPDSGDTSAFIARGLSNTNGWVLFLHPNNGVFVYFKMHNTDTTTARGDISLEAWQLVGVRRSGTKARIYVNGADQTLTAPAMPDPPTSNENLYIGAGINKFNGKLWNPRIWARALAPWEHRQIFNRERDLFGV